MKEVKHGIMFLRMLFGNEFIIMVSRHERVSLLVNTHICHPVDVDFFT
jgi:hypothetical protein